MFLRLVILFTLVPAVEIYLLVRIGTVIGAFNTLALILLTGVVGAAYARRQGLAILLDIQTAMQRGRLPAGELIDGAMLLAGGAMLLTPGFLTDATGFALIFPPSRDLLKGWIRDRLQREIERGRIRVESRGRVVETRGGAYPPRGDDEESGDPERPDEEEVEPAPDRRLRS